MAANTDNDIKQIGDWVAEAAAELSEEDFYNMILNYIKINSGGFEIIKNHVKDYLKSLQGWDYRLLTKKTLPIKDQIALLENQRDKVYNGFFELQNLINAFLGQQIILTYVFVDAEGKREVYISQNDIKHIVAKESAPAWTLNVDGQLRLSKTWTSLQYVMEEHEDILRNSLPEKENQRLQAAAIEVSRRYNKFHINKGKQHQILWQWPLNRTPPAWKGYHLTTRGPINEAYVNLYIHNIQLKNTYLEKHIDTFMLNTPYGAIAADNRNGFLIGDVAKDGYQYAVKGQYGGPQQVIDIIRNLEKMQINNFTEESFAEFIKIFTYDEMHKNIKPQIKQVSERELERLINQAAKDNTISNKYVDTIIKN